MLVDHDDDPLLAELGAALRSRQAVPDRFVELGKAAFAFRDTVAARGDHPAIADPMRGRRGWPRTGA